MRPRSAMWDHQQAAVKATLANPRLLELLDVGYGKTVVAETTLADLNAFPALVVAPATVVETGVWEAEALQWEHLSGLDVCPVTGTAERRAKRLREGHDIYVLSYNNLSWLADTLKGKLSRRFKGAVWDEVSFMKAAGARRSRRMKERTDLAVQIGLTATPVGNHLLDLWGELYVVAGPALGHSFAQYRDQYFEATDYYRRVWRLKCCFKCKVPDGCAPPHGPRPYLDCRCHREQIADIRRRIRPHVFTSPATPASLGIPPVRINPIRVPMPGHVLKLEADLVSRLWATLPSGAELEALEASAVSQKRRQMAGGVVYTGTDPGEGQQTLGRYEVVHTAKLDALDALLEARQGAPTLVFYWYRHEAEAIKARLKGYRWMDLSADPGAAVTEWNAGRLEVLLANPLTGGVGLNLQGGGSHVVWYTLPWADWVLKQGHGRLARPGQQAPWVESHWLLCGPMDDRVAEVLAAKGEVHKEITKPLTVEDLI